MSNEVLKRIVDLASKGYIVRFEPDFDDGYIGVRMSKHNFHAEHYISIEEIERSNFDVIMYAINRLVQAVDGGLQRR